jgi:hypothetical protein
MSTENDVTTSRILVEVETERDRQIAKGWTREHDGRHNVHHLVTLAERRIHRPDPKGEDGVYSRRRLLQATALLVAAISRRTGCYCGRQAVARVRRVAHCEVLRGLRHRVRDRGAHRCTRRPRHGSPDLHVASTVRA